MKPLSNQDILRIWEQGQSQHNIDRALTALMAANPNKTRTELAAMSIGERDANLLLLRELTFGSRLQGYSVCPHCNERLQFTLNSDEIRMNTAFEHKNEFELCLNKLTMRIRLPNSFDLAAAANCPDTESACRVFLQRCLIQASQSGEPILYEELSAPVMEAISEGIAEHDPLAEILIELSCTNCDCRWKAVLDIACFFWTELSVKAKRLLNDVIVLARGYGWRESDILTLSPARRRFYLDRLK